MLLALFIMTSMTIGARLSSELRAPVYERLAGAETMYQIPSSARGILFLAHGCQHSATDFWAPTAACPQCLGLPEEVRITKAALRAGFVVIAISSTDRHFTRCWNFDVDGPMVQAALAAFRQRNSLGALPLASLGASSGGAFVLQLVSLVPMAAVVSQIMAVPPYVLHESMPPTLFVHMPKDVRTASLVHKCVRKLRSDGRTAKVIEVGPQRISADFFRARIEGLKQEPAVALESSLRSAGLLDADGFLVHDPRQTPWRQAIQQTTGLSAMLPGPGGAEGPPDSLRSDESAVAEALNVAWAMHEIVSDQISTTLHYIQEAFTGQTSNGRAQAQMVETNEL